MITLTFAHEKKILCCMEEATPILRKIQQLSFYDSNMADLLGMVEMKKTAVHGLASSKNKQANQFENDFMSIFMDFFEDFKNHLMSALVAVSYATATANLEDARDKAHAFIDSNITDLDSI